MSEHKSGDSLSLIDNKSYGWNHKKNPPEAFWDTVMVVQWLNKASLAKLFQHTQTQLMKSLKRHPTNNHRSATAECEWCTSCEGVTTQQKPLYPALTASRPRPQISLTALLFGSRRAKSIGNSLSSLTVDLELNWKQELQLRFCLHLRGLWQKKMATVCYGAAMSSGLWEEESNDCTVLFCFVFFIQAVIKMWQTKHIPVSFAHVPVTTSGMYHPVLDSDCPRQKIRKGKLEE